MKHFPTLLFLFLFIFLLSADWSVFNPTCVYPGEENCKEKPTEDILLESPPPEEFPGPDFDDLWSDYA